MGWDLPNWQPALVSLFSSTSSSPVLLSHISHSLNSQHSIIALVNDDAPLPPLPAALDNSDSNEGRAEPLPLELHLLSTTTDPIYVDDSPGARLRSTVLHLQDTDVRGTFWRLGAGKGRARLGVESEWVHFGLRRLGGRAVYLEVEVRDKRQQSIVIRCSTFKVSRICPRPGGGPRAYTQ